MSKQRFAWIPTIVWVMKTKKYSNKVIWLCWYWDMGEGSNMELYHLQTGANFVWHRYVRTNNNLW